MKSAYQDPKFSDFWHEISGKKGQSYKQYVIDPQMFRLLGTIRGKRVLDLGCGNGYLGPQFIKKGARRVSLLDLSAANLVHARKLNRRHLDRVSFVQQDVTRKWKVPSASFDVVYSDMLEGAGPYFFRGFSKFIMGTASLRPQSGAEYAENFAIEHYQRPLQDYVDAFLTAGFTLRRLVEPPLSRALLAKYPGYRELSAHPIGLIFLARK